MTSRPKLEGRHFDVLVIGGGINGVAIARECARGGQKTLLVEQHDFAAGTTSRSTRLIHGGLRYLEHGDLAQVRESLRERQKLLQEYPNLVTRLQFVLALDESSRRSALAVRAGLWLYRWMGGAAQHSSSEDTSRVERLLDSGRRFSVFNFEDAQCEFPERLVAEWLVEAMRAGCIARNHTRVLAVTIANGKATGAVLRDELIGLEESIYAERIINATGPWLDQICEDSGLRTGQRMVGGVRGSHIVLPRFAGAPDAAVYTEAIDGRPIFVIPWNDQILVGSTEIADDGDPGRVRASEDEIQYLLNSLHRLFPHFKSSDQEIRYAFAGVRPLPRSSKSDPSAITRRHYFKDHKDDGAEGMISLIGGKLTTAGCAARECAEKMGIREPGIAVTATVPQKSVDESARRAIKEIAETGDIDLKSAGAIFEWYGPRALEIARSVRNDARFSLTLCPHTDHIVAEAVHAFRNECAVTLADVLLRRVPVALGACWSAECGQIAASRIASVMAWDAAQAGTELEHFATERETFLQRRTDMRLHG
jgi:glycerol-3-phosphate dehydrogenase